ncbi:uncharacterized protein PV07_11361 [Cladophialophora immunda]|uniref:Uncharacterized protein n=1 Tax=Cladophialophora immunda TaxID=569365 RepID=A0A0D2BVP7_9EURO|nr:uncharacterized protein PV07_11361 [Cladophialophora immunda]KIW23138.1 hypothetical protein PV07_11361 [Cladophialophora immunda]
MAINSSSDIVLGGDKPATNFPSASQHLAKGLTDREETPKEQASLIFRSSFPTRDPACQIYRESCRGPDTYTRTRHCLFSCESDATHKFQMPRALEELGSNIYLNGHALS